jgi:uncharacterized Zn-binding protein involved in type VI secretion
MGCPTVIIGNMPASRIGDMHTCPLVTVVVPHVGGPLILGSFTVLVGDMPQSRVTDMLICVGPPDTVVMGCTTVMVGMAGAGGLLGLLKGLALAGLSVLKRLFGGGYPRAVLQPDGSTLTEYSSNIHLSGSPVQQGRNVSELNAIREGHGGNKLLDSLGSARHPVTVNVIGDPARARALFPGKQHYENCVLQSSQQIIREATGRNYTETEMENVATHPVDSGYTRKGGTPYAGLATPLNNAGVPAHTEPGTTANVDQALANGQGVVSTHDAGTLWNDPAYAGGGHAVVTTGAVQDSNGNTLGYVINDTGSGEAGRTLSAADYQNSQLSDIVVTNGKIQ